LSSVMVKILIMLLVIPDMILLILLASWVIYVKQLSIFI